MEGPFADRKKEGPPQYEFTPEQNVLIGALANKMGWVGLFGVLIGLLLLLVSAAGLYQVTVGERHQLPLEKLTQPELQEVKAQAERAMEFIRNNRDMTLVGSAGGAIFAVILLAVGVYIRRAARAFRSIVSSQGSDISHLMTAIGSLRNTFSMFVTLLAVGLFVGIVYAVLSVHLRFGVGG